MQARRTLLTSPSFPHDEDAALPSSSMDAATFADNDNANGNDDLVHPPAEYSDELSKVILPQRLGRRDWIHAVLLVASYGLTAYAWTHPRDGMCREAPVTPITLGAPSAARPPEAPIVVPDLPVALPSAAPPRSVPPTPRRESAHRHTIAAPTLEAQRPLSPTHRASPESVVRPEEPEASMAAVDEAGPTAGDIDVALEGAVNEHLREVDACIHDAADDAAGQVSVRVVISPDGAVRSATPRGPATLANVGRCLARAIREWTIVVPGAHSDVSTSWTFEVESNAE